MRTRDVFGLATVCCALLCAGCAKTSQQQPAPAASTGAASPTPAAQSPAAASPTATASAAASVAEASASPAESSGPSPQPTGPTYPTPAATPTGPINLLSFSVGTILRAWPDSDPKYSPQYLNKSPYWRTKAGATGPQVFVYELPYPATIQSFVLDTEADGSAPAQHVRIEGSSSGASSAYAAIGDYQLKPGHNEFALSQPASVRWLRVTIDAIGGGLPTRMDSVQALGTMPLPAQAKPLTGFWLVDLSPLDYTVKLFGAGGSLPATVDYKTYADNASIYNMRVVQQGDEFRAGQCWEGKARYSHGGIQTGARSQWIDVNANADNTAAGQLVENAEGTILAGEFYGGPVVAVRMADGLSCDSFVPPVGSGKKVVVLDYDGDLINYAPAESPGLPGFRFVPQWVVLLSPQTLADADSVVLVNLCQTRSFFADWQKKALLDFAAAGHKLIIHDADGCGKSDYSSLVYPFVTSNPGAHGAPGHKLILVESDTLGSDNSQPQYYLDLPGYIATIGQQIGDANTVVSQDSHWCGHLFGTNVLNANGFMQMYARYGKGLIIYDGLDNDDHNIPTHKKILQLELAQPATGLLPCSQPVSGSFLIAPNQYGAFAPGTQSTPKFNLQVLANQGWKGTVSLSTSGDFKATVTPASAQLSGGVQPLVVAVSVPANAKPVTHVIQVSGAGGNGLTASATITLEPKQVIPKKFKRIRVYGIHFDVDSAVILPRSEPVIAQIAAILKQNPSIKMQIEGHTDSDGGAGYNLGLSQRRAQAVVTDLVKRYGIARSRLIAKGYGLTRPVAPNTTPANKALNRRVELVVL